MYIGRLTVHTSKHTQKLTLTHTHTHTHTHTYIDRERERKTYIHTTYIMDRLK